MCISEPDKNVVVFTVISAEEAKFVIPLSSLLILKKEACMLFTFIKDSCTDVGLRWPPNVLSCLKEIVHPNI